MILTFENKIQKNIIAAVEKSWITNPNGARVRPRIRFIYGKDGEELSPAQKQKHRILLDGMLALMPDMVHSATSDLRYDEFEDDQIDVLKKIAGKQKIQLGDIAKIDAEEDGVWSYDNIEAFLRHTGAM